MSQKPKALKGKVLIGYLLLFVVSAVSVWFIYGEILKIAAPDLSMNRDNRRIIAVSDAIAALYSAETQGRKAILSGSKKDVAAYERRLDSIQQQIGKIKESSERSQRGKLDTIQNLLARKKTSVKEIIAFRNKYNIENRFDRAVSQLDRVKDSLARSVKPVEFRSNTQIRQFLNRVLTPKQLDSLARLPVSNEDLTSAIEEMLTQVIVRNNKIKYSLFLKEQRLQDENRVLSDRMRVVLSALEKEILDKSYEKLQRSELVIDKTVNTMAWIAAGTFLLFVLLAWVIVRDLSVSQKYRQRLEVLNEEKENLLRSKTMLMATVTHDIKTPLGSVIGFTELLQQSSPNPRQKQYLDTINSSSQYIERLVNDLVDFSKLENNSLSIDAVPFNFNELIEASCGALKPSANQKQIGFSWNVTAELDRFFISDPYRLKQVLTNLISNAIKFTEAGNVELSAKQTGDRIDVEIVDSGIGISIDRQAAVFEEFTQADAQIEKKFGGSGLGLTIAKRLMQLLGGDISLESVLGKGTTFKISLPAVVAEYQQSEPIHLKEDFSKILYGKRILVVDDDSSQLELLSELFSGIGIKTSVQNDSRLVLQMLRDSHFDLLITDLQMPHCDGFELVAKIREAKVLENLPVVALSGNANLNLDELQQKGFSSALSKPFQKDDLLQLVSSLLRGGNPNFSDENLSGKIYDLKPLLQFTQGDNLALKNVLEAFIKSANENVADLTKAVNADDRKQISQIAHKMLPMLRQLKSDEIVRMIEPLELSADDVNVDKLTTDFAQIQQKMLRLILQIQLEIDNL